MAEQRDGQAKDRKARGVGQIGHAGRARIEVSAGGIVYRRTPKGVRIALILDPTGKWAFAKGHVEAGETVRQAAVREIREEMGLERVRVMAPLGKIDFWFRDNYRPEIRGTLIHKHVHYFLMEVPSSETGHPQREEKIREMIWVNPQRAKVRSGYADVRPVLNRAVEILASRRAYPGYRVRSGRIHGMGIGSGNGTGTKGTEETRSGSEAGHACLDGGGAQSGTDQERKTMPHSTGRADGRSFRRKSDRRRHRQADAAAEKRTEGKAKDRL